MGNSQVMPKVDFQKEELKTAHTYSRYLEAKNFERYIYARPKVIRNRVILIGSLVFVLGVYTFTLARIRQETFLDDFEEPERAPK